MVDGLDFYVIFSQLLEWMFIQQPLKTLLGIDGTPNELTNGL